MADTRGDMVERVARAIYERNSKRTNYVWPDDVYPAIRNRCLRDARAAIEAMREPTEEMVNAGAVAEGDTNLEAQARSLWEAMIDAILKDGD